MKSNRMSASATHGPHPGVIILAAGMGKRMRSSLPKVLLEIGGKPLLFHVLDEVKESHPEARVAIFVGYAREKVEQAVDHVVTGAERADHPERGGHIGERSKQ